jgi:hypothetical protein
MIIDNPKNRIGQWNSLIQLFKIDSHDTARKGLKRRIRDDGHLRNLSNFSKIKDAEIKCNWSRDFERRLFKNNKISITSCGLSYGIYRVSEHYGKPSIESERFAIELHTHNTRKTISNHRASTCARGRNVIRPIRTTIRADI